jgi:hypothetical protein
MLRIILRIEYAFSDRMCRHRRTRRWRPLSGTLLQSFFRSKWIGKIL